MAKKKSKADETPVEQEQVKEDTTPETTPEAPTVAKAKTETMTKSDAVRAAIAEGVTEPKEGVEYILKKYGMEVSAGAFSVVKSQEKKKAGGGSSAKKPVKAKANGKPTPPAPTGHDSMGGSPVALLRTVKELADTHGGEQIREILSLLGK